MAAISQTSHTPRPCGRFAPSPTGPLHFGSLIAALASCLDARHQGGRWLVRIEDLDPPRTVPGAADDILRSLEQLGFEWDGPVIWQSQRTARYQEVLAELEERHLAYACSCSRSELQAMQDHAAAEGDELRYPGRCRQGPLRPEGPWAYRLRVPETPVGFTDRLQGWQSMSLMESIGDFVIRRRDGLFAYQLAVVIDDHDQAVTDVVRGHDLLGSTPRQIALLQALALPVPSYMHVPLVVTRDGRKLSKSDAAPPIQTDRAASVLSEALCLLRQNPPNELMTADIESVWQWAKTHWDPHRLTGIRELALTC